MSATRRLVAMTIVLGSAMAVLTILAHCSTPPAGPASGPQPALAKPPLPPSPRR